MAVFNGMSLCRNTVAMAMVCLLLLSVEVHHVQADTCDQNGILGALTACLSLSTIPAKGSSCCNSMNYVYSTIKPSDTCICDIAKLSLVASLGLNAGAIKAVISACVGPFAVPGCL